MQRVAVFARWPETGRVKTRLSPALPPAFSAELHRAMLEDTLDVVAAAAADERLVFWADSPGGRAASPRAGFGAREQRGADLGERLAHAFDELLRAPGDRALILGTDCPDLGPAQLGAAFGALGARPLVLGPTRDGGYYLIGLSRRVPGLFERIAWGTDRVFEQTLERARALGLEAGPLDPLADLDTPCDLVRWLVRAAGADRGAARAPRLAAALRGIGLLPARD